MRRSPSSSRFRSRSSSVCIGADRDGRRVSVRASIRGERLVRSARVARLRHGDGRLAHLLVDRRRRDGGRPCRTRGRTRDRSRRRPPAGCCRGRRRRRRFRGRATSWTCSSSPTGCRASSTQPPATSTGRKPIRKTPREKRGHPHFVQPPRICESAIVRPAAAIRPYVAQYSDDVWVPICVANHSRTPATAAPASVEIPRVTPIITASVSCCLPGILPRCSRNGTGANSGAGGARRTARNGAPRGIPRSSGARRRRTHDRRRPPARRSRTGGRRARARRG